MKPWKWIKDHPVEAAAIAAGLALTGGAAAGAFAPAAAGAAGAGAAGASGAVAADAAAIAAAEAAAASAGSPALLGAGAGGASLGAEAAAGAGLGAESALLSAVPLAGEDFAAQMAAQSMATGAGGFDPAIAGQFANTGGAEASLYGPGVATSPATALGPESTWLSRMGPKEVMRLGQMTMQMGTPRPQGGPQGGFEQPSYRSAMHSQEDITKKWLLQNDPNTYRRIYGNPPGVA